MRGEMGRERGRGREREGRREGERKRGREKGRKEKTSEKAAEADYTAMVSVENRPPSAYCGAQGPGWRACCES